MDMAQGSVKREARLGNRSGARPRQSGPGRGCM